MEEKTAFSNNGARTNGYAHGKNGPGLPCWLGAKNPPANAGDSSSIPGSGRSPGEGNGNPLQYPCLGNPVDRGTWQATVHGIVQVKILEWVAFPFSRGSSQTRYRIHVSCISADSLPAEPQGKPESWKEGPN